MANRKRDDSLDGQLIHVKGNKHKVPYRMLNGKPGNRYYVKINCDECGKEVLISASSESRCNKSYCSRNCRYKNRIAPNGKTKRKRGSKPDSYILIKSADHPHAGKDGYIPLHRHVVEMSLGRILDKNELVHHIDMDKENNNIENLDVIVGNKDHCLCHRSIQKCVRKIIDSGKLHYDREKKIYYF